MKKLTSLSLPVYILLFGALLRTAGINASAIWYDEAFTWHMARLPLGKMLAQQWLEYSPPLWNLIMRPFAHGPLWVLRLPALAASLASLYVVHLLMERLDFTEWQRSLTAALVSFLPGLLWTAQDGRVYAFLSLLYLLAFLYALDGKWRHLGLVSVLMLYSHNTAPFLLAPVYLIALIHHREQGKKIFTTGLVSLFVFSPWVPSIIGRSGSFWLGEWMPGDALLQMVFAVWVGTLPGDYLTFIFFAFAFLTTFWFFVSFTPNDNRLWLLNIMPLFLLVTYSIAAQNIFFYRPLIALIIPYALWGGSLLPKKTWAKTTVTLVWVALLGVGLWHWQPATKGAHLDRAADYIADHWQPGDALYYTTGTVALPFGYYLPEKPALLMDVEHDTGLMQRSHAWAFGIPTGELTPPKPCCAVKRAWVIIPNDPLLSDEAQEQLAWVHKKGKQIGFIDYAQAADIEIWLVE